MLIPAEDKEAEEEASKARSAGLNEGSSSDEEEQAVGSEVGVLATTWRPSQSRPRCSLHTRGQTSMQTSTPAAPPKPSSRAVDVGGGLD